MKKFSLFLVLIAFVTLYLYQKNNQHRSSMIASQKGVKHAIAVIEPTDGFTTQGIVRFTQKKNGVDVYVKLRGLTPGNHGFHVHEYGDISSPDGKANGGHFNPFKHHHASPDAKKRHMGDLGNIVADKQGKVDYRFLDTTLQLHGNSSIIGRSIIVHADADDLRSQPSGSAGTRIGQGVIGITK